MADLFSVQIFTRDLEALPRFYMEAFGFKEIEEARTPIARMITTGQSHIGFNAFEAYEILNLAEHAATAGVKSMLNLTVDSVAEVERLVPVCIRKGAKLVKEPYKTYYNWYQTVLFDPEMNVFRINKPL